jgi:hypothetical protein
MCPVPPLLLKQNHFGLKFYQIFRPGNELKWRAVLGIWVQSSNCALFPPRAGPSFPRMVCILGPYLTGRSPGVGVRKVLTATH